MSFEQYAQGLLARMRKGPVPIFPYRTLVGFEQGYTFDSQKHREKS